MIFIWVILYGIIFVISEKLSFLIGIDHIITIFTLLIFVICFIIYTLKKSKQNEEINVFLIKNFKFNKDFFLMIPLLCFPLFNLIIFRANFDIMILILMVSICMLEELFFRKYLLEAIIRKNKTLGFFLSALIFALFHFSNILNNSSILYISLQIIVAFFVGLCYNGLVLKYQSILPTFLLHLLTNICGVGDLNAYANEYIIGLCFCTVIYFIYGVWFFINQTKKT